MSDTAMTRRGLLGFAAAGALSLAQTGDGLIDYHAHIDAAPPLDALLEISKNRKVQFGVVEHAGNRKDHLYRGLLANDGDLNRYIERLKGRPCLIGIQAEGLDWMG